MSKKTKKLLSILILAILLLFIGFQLLRYNTKKHSPETTITHTIGASTVTVTYSAPYKKGRPIFGSLVPYNQIWRTGANEPTTFTTTTPLSIDGSQLPKGTYTLWTIPGEKSWKIIFNRGLYNWGVSFDGTPTHDPALDTLVLEVPKQQLLNIVEQFSIYFEDTSHLSYMYLAWDTTVLTIPIRLAKD